VIQAELSLYPLNTELIESVVRNFIKELSNSGVSVVFGQMSTLVTGESEEVFRVIGECFEKACRTDKIVLVVKFSNACPETVMQKGEDITTSIVTARGSKTTDLQNGSKTMAIEIDENKCTGCGICVQVCPVEAITVERVATINPETCTGCGSCVAECPSEAIFAEGMKPAPPWRVKHTSSSHISATRAATPPTVPRVFSDQSVFQQVVRSGGLLKQIFDLFRSSTGQGRGRGKGHGGGRGRGKGRRA